MANQQTDQEPAANNNTRKKSSLVPLLLLIIALLVVGGGGFIAYIKLIAPGHVSHGAKQPEAQKNSQDTIGEMYPLEPFTVNLADPKGKRYIKIKIELELDTPDAKERLEKAIPKIRDTVIVMLTSLSFEEVMTPEGKIRIRDELLVRFNQILKPERLRNIYFTEFLVQ